MDVPAPNLLDGFAYSIKLLFCWPVAINMRSLDK